MDENLPPFPGVKPPAPPRTSLTAYILRGQAWVEIGTATAHPDGGGHRLKLHLAPEDGDVIELRTPTRDHDRADSGPKAVRRTQYRPRRGR